MVITYEDSDLAVRAFYTLRESRYDDKTLLGEYTCCIMVYNYHIITNRIYLAYTIHLCASDYLLVITFSVLLRMSHTMYRKNNVFGK